VGRGHRDRGRSGWGALFGVHRAAPAGQEMFVEDYLRRAVGAEHIQSSDPVEVTTFVTRELGQPFAPITIDGVELERAEICLLEGRRGAMIVYKIEGEVVSHYVVPRPGGVVRPPRFGRELGRGAGAPSVITWATPRLEQALVGVVPADALMLLARRASTQD
jgi:hypothetical protein